MSLIAENRYLDVKKDYRTTLKELLDKYDENYRHQASYKTGKKTYLENFKNHFGEDTRLSNIRYVELESYRNQVRQKPTHFGTIRTDASVNREMACLHHLFAKAVEWDMMEQNPFERGNCLLLKENNKRLRYLTEEEIPRLLDSCKGHIRDIIECALNTGMRRGEILSLKWSQIRNGFIYLQKTKTNIARQIPINDDLHGLFERIKIRQAQPKENVVGMDGKPVDNRPCKSEYVFNYNGRPVSEVKRSFKKALDDAGIEDFRFHDLRHTFASHMIMRGASIKEVQEILGHRSLTMTMRYAHLSQEHKKKAVNLLNGLTAPSQKPSEEPMSQNVTSSTLIEN
ncbi:MAG: site-specific integrase, partial [Proteobacteria bacterium]|nr:site-specific integrase [Pseudomonadota bacterium]